jgi:perosamine synthetase
LEQLIKYNTIKNKRREIASRYFDQLKLPNSWIMPPEVEGATYSHFVIRVPDRSLVMEVAADKGLQLGQLIEYSMPHLPNYQEYSKQNYFPKSLLCSQSTINLPIYPGLEDKKIRRIIEVVNNISSNLLK